MHTNPAAFDEAGRLRIAPHHDAGAPPHGCARCPPNMCKGAILAAAVPSGARVFYAGDGSGDVCPALALHGGSVACARRGDAMARALREAAEAGALRARLEEWRDGNDVLRLLRGFLDGGGEGGAAPG